MAFYLNDNSGGLPDYKPANSSSYNGPKTFSSVNQLVKAYLEYPNDPDLAKLVEQNPQASALVRLYQAQQDYENGNIDANSLLKEYGSASNVNLTMSPETEKWLDNEIARENTQQQQNYEINARDTSLLSAGQQLEQLGLSPSNVISVGGASAGVQGSTAATSHQSASSLHQQEKINRFNQQMGLAKSLIGAASSMASSGIYGAAIGAVKHSASQIAGQAAHSGLTALRATKMSDYVSDKTWNAMLAKLGY